MKTRNKIKVLVAYFSHSGNTKKIAQQIHELTNGDLFKIEPVHDYPAVYNELLDVAKKEIRLGEKPVLKNMLNDLDRYNIIFIGYPNWWNTFPASVRTFLSEYNFYGKTIIPFCTHGGGGFGHSISDIAKQCPGAIVLKEFSINGYAVSNNNAEVEKWLDIVLDTSIS